MPDDKGIANIRRRLPYVSADLIRIEDFRRMLKATYGSKGRFGAASELEYNQAKLSSPSCGSWIMWVCAILNSDTRGRCDKVVRETMSSTIWSNAANESCGGHLSFVEFQRALKALEHLLAHEFGYDERGRKNGPVCAEKVTPVTKVALVGDATKGYCIEVTLGWDGREAFDTIRQRFGTLVPENNGGAVVWAAGNGFSNSYMRLLFASFCITDKALLPFVSLRTEDHSTILRLHSERNLQCQ